MENNSHKTIRAFWTWVSPVLYVLTILTILFLFVFHCPLWAMLLISAGMLLLSWIIDYKKTRCPYCHSTKVIGPFRAKGSQEFCPRCKHLIDYK